MKILPPLTQWLPAVVFSRIGSGLLGAAVIVITTTLALRFAAPPPANEPHAGRTAPATPTYTPSSKTCSGLVLDRRDYTVTPAACPAVAIKAGASITTSRPLPRTALPPRSNRLTDADRAIAVPESLRTSVWEVGIAPRTSGDDAAAEAALTATRERPPQ